MLSFQTLFLLSFGRGLQALAGLVTIKVATTIFYHSGNRASVIVLS